MEFKKYLTTEKQRSQRNSKNGFRVQLSLDCVFDITVFYSVFSVVIKVLNFSVFFRGFRGLL
jgi:hypothetical protein